MGAREDAIEAVRKAAVEVDGRNTLSCAEALRIADATNLDFMDVGGICNEEKIKLVRCQLGCFK